MNSSTTIRCTLTKIPTTASLLQRCRLPFGLHIYPFAGDDPDMALPVISDTPIVRCRNCRTYFNPYIRMVDQRRWQCNMCHRVSDIPSGFYYDAHTQQQIDIRSRPELNYASVEYIAGSDYLVRAAPQPACYMFVFERSRYALDIGFIPVLAKCIIDCLDDIPGDARASIGFIAYDSNVHYYTFGEGRVTHLVAPDVQSDGAVFLPSPTDNILVKVDSQRELIIDFLHEQLANFVTSDTPLLSNDDNDSVASVVDANSALGPAIQSAYEVLAPIGGRITVIQAHIANCGNANDGSVLTVREDPNQRANTLDRNSETLTPLLNPATDFYKKLALQCAEHQIAIDLFNLSTTYADLATVASLARYSAGSVYHYSNEVSAPRSVLTRFEYDLRHYLTRPLGLEAVLRLRCSHGLSVHTFHGNCFVRSTDLLVLPNVNPDASYAMQISIDEDLRDMHTVSFQAALLYTTPIGERRIRVHTATYASVTTLSEVMMGADQEAIAAMLAKMAVDRSLQRSIGEANEALATAGVDLIEAYQLAEPSRAGYGLPNELSLIPLYVLALLKHTAFRSGVSTKLDDRIAAMERLKTLPLHNIVSYIYPDLYPVHVSFDPAIAYPNPLQLSAANIDRAGAYLLDSYDTIILYVCQYVDPQWCQDVFGVTQWAQIPDYGDSHHYKYQSLPELENATSHALREFICYLIEDRASAPKFMVLRDDSRIKSVFLRYMIDDRSESQHSYYEFLQHLQNQVRR